MNIVPLTSDTIAELRSKRTQIIQNMIQDQEGVLLVLGGAFAGENRQINSVSYAIVTIFFELWERYTFESWSYTFDADGIVFYIRIDESETALKNTMIHYEDYHPLGFAIHSQVFSKEKEITREELGVKERLDFHFKKPVETLLDETIIDAKYQDAFVKKIEEQIIKTDKQSVLSNILVYGYVSAFAKPLGFGMYGPNHRGSNSQMNFEKFIYFLRTYSNELKRITNINANNPQDVMRYQKEIENKIQLAVLNQQSYYYTVYMTSIVLFAFLNSSGYMDVSPQIKKLADAFYPNVQNSDEASRYDISRTGLKEVFTYYVPFLQKNKSTESTLLYILSRYDDVSILTHNGKQNLLKVQFLAKNLVAKEDKWLELDRFCVANSIYPHDSTVLLAITYMLDIIQRNYIKIKMLFDNN